ncbi:MAG: tetratricopeptide repeat protein [Salinivirgaceae bacterium]
MKFNFAFLFLLVFIGFSSCKTTTTFVVTKDSSLNLSDNKKFEFKHLFFDANKYMLNGDYDNAISHFKACLAIDNTSSASYYKLASIYLIKQEFALAEEYAEKAVWYNNDNIWYLYLAGNLYGKNGKYEKAIDVFERLIQIDENEIDFYLNLADVYLSANDLKAALKTYNTIQAKFGIAEIISLQKHKVYASQGKEKEAINELKILASAFDNEAAYKRNIADYYLQLNKLNEAIAEYQNILLKHPGDAYSYLGLAEAHKRAGNVKESFSALKSAFKNRELPSDVKISVLVSLLPSIENTDIKISVIELTEIILEQYPDDPDVNTIYANFLLQANDIQGAKKHLEKVLEVRKDKYAIWEQLILVYNQLLDWPACFSVSNQAIEYFPNQGFLYFFKGFSGFQLEKFSESVEAFEFGLKLITKTDPLYKDFLTFLGESYHKTGKKDKAYRIFDQLLEEDAQNIMVLNNYAYYLSVDDERLDKAEKMSKITVTKEPKNPTYLDTYAWILFRQKKYTEALEYIEKAIAYDLDKSAVITEHYGDILFHNNAVDEAISQWNKALELGEGSSLLKQKIDAKTYIE